MDYRELTFNIVSNEEFHRDLLINTLSEIGFDTFEETDLGFKAYIPTSQYSKIKLELRLVDFEEMFDFSYTEIDIPYKNWNDEWESNFEPIVVTDQCYVRATFHPARPDFKYEVVVDPKMAFGTGHHQTTSMMMQWMLSEKLHNKAVLDMGCGTGILAILAAKMDASEITAIDYNPLCFESAMENKKLNNTNQVLVLCGSKEVIPEKKFDIILANINRNILLDQLDRYAEVLKIEGLLFLSGFYEETDLAMITGKAQSLRLKYLGHKTEKNWVAAKFSKL